MRISSTGELILSPAEQSKLKALICDQQELASRSNDREEADDDEQAEFESLEDFGNELANFINNG